MGYKFCSYCHQKFFDPKECGRIYCSGACQDKAFYETKKRQQFRLIFKKPPQFDNLRNGIKLLNKGG